MNHLRTKKGISASRPVNLWFLSVFFAVSLLSWVWPRADYSETEGRYLHKFPALTLEALASGSFFDDINLWFADTFPFRDQLVDLNAGVTRLFGWQSTQIHGNLEQGDEIPDIPSRPQSQPTVSAPAVSDPVSSQVTSAPVSSAPVSSEPVSSTPVSSTPVSSAPVSSTPEEDIPKTTETLNALLVVGDTAYEYYNFSRSTGDLYVSAVTRLADQLAGKVNVYDIVIPTGIDVALDPATRKQVQSANQRNAINYLYGSMGANVRTVDILDTLLAHRDEYLYFRTDHHWTAQAAYYAYEEFMKARGVAPTPLSAFTPLEFPNFLGSFYRSTKKASMVQNPDTVYAFRPTDTNDITVYPKGGGTATYRIVGDVTTWNQDSKYLCFIAGDQPYSIIQNPNVTDGSCCIVVKESFGNAFVPFLTGNFQYIHVVDYRYFNLVDNRKLGQLALDVGATDVLFLNNISATRSKGRVNEIDALVG